MSDAVIPAANGSPTGPVADEAPLASYQAALSRYDLGLLREIGHALGIAEPGLRSRALAGLIADRLAEKALADRLLAGLGSGPRLALGLAALTEAPAWPLAGMSLALSCLGVEPSGAIRTLAELGLVALGVAGDGPPVGDLARLIEEGDGVATVVVAHPAAVSASRTVLPDAEPPAPSRGTVGLVREADGLEPILRLAAVWQRVAEAPLRQTQLGTTYKKDRDRIEDDAVLAGPIADALEPLPDMAAFWLALARGVGLVVPEPGSDRVVAAPPEYWSENAYHLPQMVATRWLGLRSWHEQAGMRHEASAVELALPYARPAVLLWLAAMGVDAWVALDDLDRHLRGLAPGWDRATLVADAAPPAPPRGRAGRGRANGRMNEQGEDDAGALEALLLGPAYQLGLVRAAEEVPGGRRVVQLSPLGRYVLALGPPPAPRPGYEHFLFVQPNFEIVAYRQGLTPALIGQFSRFARWSQVGAALELRLTPETVYRGLEGGLTTDEMLGRLSRHSARPLPAGVAEAMRTWAGRRERVTYHASATLIEFATHKELLQALAEWPEAARAAPVVVADRLLLVEDESAIPFQRFRLAGSRDYRRPPEACLEVEPDGVTMALDLGRSDLLVDAELARFADELPPAPSRGAPGLSRRRFRVSPASLSRGLENGLTPATLSQWYERRTGADVPAAVRLLLLAASPRVPSLATGRPLLLRAPTAELLDGLAQHPDTRDLLGERLGPTAVVVPDASVEPLRRALAGLGLALPDPSEDGADLPPAPPPRRGRNV
jgi:hypothetical protein